jgi:N utilization substance protein A
VLNEEEHKAEVYLDPDQVSLAIGKGGLNIKLASMLTGYTIDVFREIDNDDNDDVSLDEFTDDIEPWIIEELKKIGYSTARDVLAESRETLIQRTDLEEETIDEVLNILAAEFE